MTLGKKKILFVDDEELATKYFERSFGERFEVLTANSSEEAQGLLQIHADEIGVLATDQRMPGGSGVELLRLARSQYPRIIRILLTAYTDHETMLEAVNSGGVYRYLIKPYEPDELAETLDRALEFHSIHEERDELLRERVASTRRALLSERLADMGSLALGMGHHLRNALVPVRSFLDMLEQKDQPKAIEGDLGEFYAAAQERVQEVLERLEDIERWGRPTEPETPVSIRLLDLLESALASVADGKKSLSIDLGGVPVELELLSDEKMLKEAFSTLFEQQQNLLPDDTTIVANAKLREPSSDGSEQLRLRLKSDEDWWKPGISLLELFDPFRIQPDEPSQTAPHLLGFFFLITRLGGEMRLEHRSPKGLDLVVDLPVSLPPIKPLSQERGPFLARFEALERAWESHLVGS